MRFCNAGLLADAVAILFAPTGKRCHSFGRPWLRPATRFRWGFAAAGGLPLPPASGGSFFKSLDRHRVLSGMLGAGRYVREAQFLQYFSHRPLVIINAKAFPDHTLQVKAPPTNDAILVWIGALLDNPRKLFFLSRRQPRLRSARPAVDQAIRTVGVKTMNPITQRLAIHPANPCRIASIQTVVNRCNRQQPPNLPTILATPRQSTNLKRRKIIP